MEVEAITLDEMLVYWIDSIVYQFYSLVDAARIYFYSYHR